MAIPQIKAHKGPAFIKADFVEYNAEEDYVYATGNIKIAIDDYVLTGRRVLYDIEKDLLWAEGDVRITDKKGHRVFGETVFFKNQLKIGIISNFIIKFDDNTILASRLAKRIDENKTSLHNANFTPCDVNCGNKPIWQITARDTNLDLDKQKVTYNNVFFKVYGVPVFFTPYFSHPSPGAPAQSGILVPKIKKNDLMIPFYFRPKPNMDFTITPRISKKYIIYGGEARHKLKNGYYSLEGSYGKVPYAIKDEKGVLIKNTKVNSYHIFTQGNFSQNHNHYGFNLKRTSDKAYLKNYFSIYDSYLPSKIYFNNVNYYDYVSIESLYFQGLRAEDSPGNSPLILPKLKTKNIINLNDDETTYLAIENNTLIYREPTGTQLARESLQLSVTNDYVSNGGHLLSFDARTRGDAYVINHLPAPTVINSEKVFGRNIPEAGASWRYPLVSSLNANNTLSLEPIIVANMGLRFKNGYNKFSLLESGKYELGDDNLFLSNHYSGIDYHEYGNRLAYGLSSGLLSGSKYFTLFLGQFHYKHNNITASGTGENVGRAAIDFDNQFALFYRFRKNKRFQPIRDELGANFYGEKLLLTTSYIKLQNLKEYYSTDDKFDFSKDHAKQAYYNIEYQLTENLRVGNEARIDLTSRRMPLLYRSIRVTYVKDCVSISAKFYDDYTSDSLRGIKKTRAKTISIGLKVLNM